MKPKQFGGLLIVSFLFFGAGTFSVRAQNGYSRDGSQAIDDEYTKKIREYTTETFFNSPLTDYLPASPNVPTPKAVLGDVAGAPGKLPYAEDVYKYMRMLEKATPRVKVFSIGTSEEGREMIAVAIASEKLMSELSENHARLAKLGDPRTINLDDAEADRLVDQSFPIYYITGTIHSPETGAPTALMELAYRLVVDDSPYIRNIRDHMVTLITPVVEVDGRNRMVDIYNWHLAHPGQNWPGLVYWGHYVAHDNNRDAIGLSLKLTRNVLNTFTGWKAQVLHDLHESVPYLYDNTVGDGPYNAWIDPILADEWEMIGWKNVSEMTKFGMPGVFTHGTFDTWSPGYLMFIAATHNGISRLYETFGNAGADTLTRTLSPDEYSRTWYRQNPPLPRAKWSQRNNNNYEETALLISLDYFNKNSKLFLKNFYLKAKRSIEKPKNEGPAAYVFPGDDPRAGNQASLLRLLQAQGCEIHRATTPFTITIKKKSTRRDAPVRTANPQTEPSPAAATATPSDAVPRASSSPSPSSSPAAAARTETETRTFPAGSYLVRMDQPYSRIADALLDYQYWSPRDPQQNVYDDTGWTFGELGNVQVVRVTDAKVLDAAMERVNGDVHSPGGVNGTGSIFIVNHNADNSLVTLRYRLRKASFESAEEPFEAAGKKFNRGSFIIRNVSADELSKTATELGVQAYAVAQAPPVKMHPIKVARIALLHTWLNTQDEGWWRLAYDQMHIPYDYISTQEAAKDSDLNKKYDVIVFGPGSGNANAIIQGRPMYGNPIPWKKTELTPNLGGFASTDDMRPGLGYTGLMNLQNFVKNGGVFVGADDSATFAVSAGFTPGVSIQSSSRLRAIGDLLKTRMVDGTSPIAYGYGDMLSAYCFNGPIFNVSNVVGGGGGGGRRGTGGGGRATGRGSVDDPDVVQGRPPAELPEPPPPVEIWEASPINEEQRRNLVGLIPLGQRPRVILRWGNANELLVSGLLDGGDEIAQHAAVIDSPLDRGNVILFSMNPFWRGQTSGSYSLVFNTILNFDNLNAG